jgi:5-azacytidine-induced protein 1
MRCCVALQGLEVEVQRLISRHRTELAAAADRAAEQTKSAVEAAKTQHEAALAAMKERLRQVGR